MGKTKDGDVAWFAPDSNFFLHCRQPEELDWSLVTEAGEIVLMPVRTVQREIDSLKGQGNQRRAARARKVAALFGNLVSTEDVHVYREAGPRVVMRRVPRPDPALEKPAGLDMDVADDRMVAEAMATAKSLGVQVSLISRDSGPAQTAHDLGLPFHRTPDVWLLPPEPDAVEKENAELKRQLQVLRASAPVMVAEVLQAGIATRVITGEVDETGALTPHLVEQVRKAISARHPLRHRSEARGVYIYREEDWATYRAQYETWEEGVAGQLDALSKLLEATIEPVHFQLHINNTGTVTADHPRIEVVPKGPLSLVVESERETLATLQANRVFTYPPASPLDQTSENNLHWNFRRPLPLTVGNAVTSTSGFALGDTIQWAFDIPKVASQRAVGESLKFRHGLDGETLDFFIRPEPGRDGPVTGSVDVRISASNLPEPLTLQFRVSLARCDGGTVQKIRKKIMDDLSVRFLPSSDVT